MHASLASSSIIILSSLLSPQMPNVLSLLLFSSLKASDDGRELIKKPPPRRINAGLAIVVEGGLGEATTSNAHLLVAVCDFIVHVVSFIVLVPLCAVVVNFVNDREEMGSTYPCFLHAASV